MIDELWRRPNGKVASPDTARIAWTRKQSRIYRRITVLYAHKGGGPVLKDEARLLRHVSGLLMHCRYGTVVINFRHVAQR